MVLILFAVLTKDRFRQDSNATIYARADVSEMKKLFNKLKNVRKLKKNKIIGTGIVFSVFCRIEDRNTNISMKVFSQILICYLAFIFYN